MRGIPRPGLRHSGGGYYIYINGVAHWVPCNCKKG
jgi:hypothetical protein